jgi:hypothetical protein
LLLVSLCTSIALLVAGTDSFLYRNRRILGREVLLFTVRKTFNYMIRIPTEKEWYRISLSARFVDNTV